MTCDFVSNDTTSVPQGSTPTPSRYNIELTAANDNPTITTGSSSLVVNSAATPVALPAITLADLDVAGCIGAVKTASLGVMRLLRMNILTKYR